MGDEHDEGYTGPATLTVDGRDVAVRVVLDARHEPQDGRLHWFGRLTLDGNPTSSLVSALMAPSSRIELSTDGRRADARIGDVDPWGRYRITGVGRPPFTTDEPSLDED